MTISKQSMDAKIRRSLTFRITFSFPVLVPFVKNA